MRALKPLHPGLRIAALSVFAFGAINRGCAYIDTPSTPFTTFVDIMVPLHWWAWVWIGAGVAMVAGIWHRIIARWALSLGGSLWAVWGISFYASWIAGDQTRGWVTGGAFITIAGAMYITAALADSVGPPEDPVMGRRRLPR